MKAVFIWKVDSGLEDEFVRRWQTASEVIQQYPGALGTKLHRSHTDPAIFFAYASWTSKEARQAMVRQVEADDRRVNGHDELSTLIFSDEFEDPALNVEPNAS